MSDEMESMTVDAEEFFAEPDQEPAPEPSPEPEPAPEPEVDPRVKELEEKEAALKKREKELEKGFRKIAEREQSLWQTEAPKPSEPLGELDDEAAKVLRSFIQRELGDKLSAIDTLYNDAVSSTIDGFAASKGVEADELLNVLQESGVQPASYSPRGLKDALNAAYAIMESRNQKPVDLEAERAKWEAEFMAKLKEDGVVSVDSIEPPNRPEMQRGDVMEDEEMTPAERYAALVAKDNR